MKSETNHCPEGGHHSFILGRCFNCGLSIREHKARVKEKIKARLHRKKNESH